MDAVLCDELLQEIFTRLPAKPSSSSSSSSSLSVCLVSKRWLHLYRTSRTSLSLKLIPHNSVVSSLSSFLSHYPSLSSLSLAFSSSEPITTTTSFCDSLLLVVSSSCNSKLKLLRFLGGPVSVNSLLSLSRACNSLTSITVSVSRPLFLNWVASFSCLKELSLYACDDFDCYRETGLRLSEEIDAELGLESLSLSGIRSDDFGVGLLWRSCKRLKKLQLKSCSGIGDGKCLQGLLEVELRTCRSIVDVVLLKLG
ncbi:hypothetical protein Pint_02802 [Pistacia integerrima]|uniref:Uncharacterized protein n=1 Tax=Pistacia integerrima TaxID=434235 RepID=A0ACC0ZK00_9ROSI|nr:hypothetical protein Pint_02802 [Pistacia integerrima]